VKIHSAPNEMDPAIPFAENTVNKSYDPTAANAIWKAMLKVNGVFSKFRSEFISKYSPVHLFWGAFDLAVTRFSGNPAPLHPGGMPNMPLAVMQEAYSQEVSSAGFWPGSKDSPMPVFYAYAYPNDSKFGEQKVAPSEAFYSTEMGELFSKYEDVQKSDDPEKMLVDFLRTTYEAAFNHAVLVRCNLSYPTQNQAINAIKLFYAVHDGLVVPEQIQRPRKSTRLPEVLTKEEFKAIFAKLRNLKHRALVGLIYGCDLRIGEAINLELKDIRPESNMLYIRQAKGRKDRPVPLSVGVYVLLDQYIKSYAPHVYVFEGAHGGKYSYSSSRQLFQRAVRSSGMRRHITLHTLRHSYATHLLQSGTDIRYIQKILGHTDPKTTMIYTRVTIRDLHEIKSPFDDMGF